MATNFFVAEFSTIILILICLLLSAFFSSAETAITSLGTLKVKHLLDSQPKRAASLKIWLTQPSRIISTILLFNNVVNILASSLTTKLTFKYFESGAVGIATGVTTFWVLVFGEIVPKSFAKSRAEPTAIFSMKFIIIVYYLTYPIVKVLSDFAEIMIRLVSKGKKSAPLITEEEIEFIVSEGEKAGVIEDIKKDIIEGAFDFDETKVREIMTPRTDLTALEVETPFAEILDQVIQTGHSRIPIFRDNIDHIVGLVLAKDLLSHNQEDAKLKGITAKSLMREAFFAPESKSIMDVFKDLKRTKSHMAVIIDEYGGTAGIVTMEDIIEEFVGEIQDEFDAEQAKIVKKSESLYDVSGAINIQEFLDHFDVDAQSLPEEVRDSEVDTLAGLFTHLVGQMPKRGQKVEIGPLKLEVIAASSRRIDMIRVSLGAVQIKNV